MYDYTEINFIESNILNCNAILNKHIGRIKRISRAMKPILYLSTTIK